MFEVCSDRIFTEVVFVGWKVMIFARHSSKLSALLVLLIIVQECFMDGRPNDETTGTSTSDPNNPAARQLKPTGPGKFANLGKKFVPNKEKWTRRGRRFISFFTLSPPTTEDTLKQSKVALIALYKILDSKIFDSCANPLSFHIDHFDVRNHMLTNKYIKTKPYDEKFMNIYDLFLKECCHPLIDLYDKRLNEDQTEEQKSGNLKYTPIEVPYQPPEPKKMPRKCFLKSIFNRQRHPAKPAKSEPGSTPDTSNVSDNNRVSVAEPPASSEIPPPSSETPPATAEASASDPAAAQAPGSSGGGRAKQIASSAAKATRHGLAVGGVNDQLIKRKLKKGPFEPRALTYWKKAVIYRTVKWASPFLIVPLYTPSILLKRKLEDIVYKYGMNLLDPEHGNLRSWMRYFDCTPIKPTDLENCCIEKDKTIEHLYHIGDLYNKQKEKKEEEKRERKRLKIKKEKKPKVNKARLNSKEKFKLKMKKQRDKYGFYPVEPISKSLSSEVIYAFLPDKFEEIFSMKPKVAKEIILKRYKIRKYEERAQRARKKRTEANQAPNGPVGEAGSTAIDGQVASQGGVTDPKQANTETGQGNWLTGCWYAATHSIASFFTDKISCGKKTPPAEPTDGETAHHPPPPPHPENSNP